MTEEIDINRLKLWTFKRPTAWYLAASLSLWMADNFVASAYAISRFRKTAFIEQLANSVSTELREPVVMTLGASVFVVLAFAAAAIHRGSSALRGAIIFVLVSALVSWLYWDGFWQAEVVFANGFRTAAALNAGMPFVLTTGLVTLLCVLRKWIASVPSIFTKPRNG